MFSTMVNSTYPADLKPFPDSETKETHAKSDMAKKSNDTNNSPPRDHANRSMDTTLSLFSSAFRPRRSLITSFFLGKSVTIALSALYGFPLHQGADADPSASYTKECIQYLLYPVLVCGTLEIVRRYCSIAMARIPFAYITDEDVESERAALNAPYMGAFMSVYMVLRRVGHLVELVWAPTFVIVVSWIGDSLLRSSVCYGDEVAIMNKWGRARRVCIGIQQSEPWDGEPVMWCTAAVTGLYLAAVLVSDYQWVMWQWRLSCKRSEEEQNSQGEDKRGKWDNTGMFL